MGSSSSSKGGRVSSFTPVRICNGAWVGGGFAGNAVLGCDGVVFQHLTLALVPKRYSWQLERTDFS